MPLKKSQTETPTNEAHTVASVKSRLKNKESSPKDGKNPKRLPFRRFYNAVRDDVSVITDAIEYYGDVVEDGAKHLTLKGNLESMVAETPGLAYFYRGVRTDAQQIRRWLETDMTAKKADKFKYFHHDPEAKKKWGVLKPTEITKYVEADEEVQDLADLIREMAEVEHRLEDLMEGFEERRLALSRIVDIRRDNLKEVWIDVSAGDDNA